jgi:muconate cycloisomerase
LLSASVDLALLDLNGKRLGAPVYELLGGRCREAVACSWVSYLRPAELLADEIRRKLGEGYTEFKLKAGDIELDLERARIFREVAGDEVFLRVDASGLWEEEEAVENIRRLAELGVQAVETPIAAASRVRGLDDPETVGAEAAMALARVRKATGVAQIEHVGDFPDSFALALVEHGAVDVFNVIPAQTGSFHRAQRLIHLAEQAGLSAMLGSTVELGPGTSGSVHLATACPAVSVPSDLVGPGFLVGDVVAAPLQYAHGTLVPTEAPGLGVELDRQRLTQFAAS